MIQDYQILVAREGQLEVAVRNLLPEGWIPQGGICLVNTVNGNPFFGQAMIKVDDQNLTKLVDEKLGVQKGSTTE